MHCTQIFTNNKNIIEMCSNHNFWNYFLLSKLHDLLDTCISI